MTLQRNMLVAVALVVGSVAGAAGMAIADQPYMHSALDNLRDARANLEHASADKGGHRVTAIGLVDQAITEVKAGIEYDRTH